ncbi:unnamed protein product [Hermetia illucens]|uniref:Tubulin polyglutamylase TTLL6 n=1 Tax=Hermetia illucens TaxID=343691 RepID=A0A7R8V6A5_HERIL|nr:unnamed protein product [Hermetia illucens]
MKTKFKKFQTPRENVRLLIQPRQHVIIDEGEDTSCDDSADSPTVASETHSIPSNSSIVEVPCIIRKEDQNSSSDGFRALLKVNDDCYEVDINHDNRTPISEEDAGEESDGRNGPSICLAGTRYPCISRVCRSLGFKIVRESDLWNIYWTDSIQGVDMYKDMKRFQKVNHFPGMIEVCRKDLLARNLIRMLRLFPAEYNFFPKTWCFPADLGDAISYSRQYRNKTFILKPDTGAQGKGIWLTKNLKEIKPNERMICQVYVSKPLLIDGFKFDLRVYTLVTSVNPLRVFVYNEGLARFATSKYKEPSGHNTSNVYMHLTNYSVNKHSRTFSKDDELGSKRKFSTLNRILMNEGYDVEKLWNSIDEIIVKTLLSAWPVLKHNYHACFPCHDVVQACFEILGFDILVDSRMKPLLLEVNHSPSFHTDEQIDKEVKEALLHDTFQILNISVVDKKKILKEDKRRVQSRLLQKIRDNNKAAVDTDPINFDGVPHKVLLSPNTQQIAWEESHLGNFRRVMPAPNNPNKYTAFLILQNQSSIYSDTAASKRREEAAKQLRSEIIQKALKDQKYAAQNMRKQIDNSNEGTAEQKKKKVSTKKRWPVINNSINEVEERERIMLLSQRDFLIRSSGLVQLIFDSFYRHDLLSASDREKFKELYEQKQTEDVNSKQDFSHGEQCRIHNKQINQREALVTATVQHTQSNCRLPKVSGTEYPPEENLLSRYISSMPIANPSHMLERLQRVRGKYSELYRKTLPKDRDKFIS